MVIGSGVCVVVTVITQVNVVAKVNFIFEFCVVQSVVIMAMQKAMVGHLLTQGSGKYLQCVRWAVADHTCSTHLSVWEPLELSQGKWYCVTSIRLKHHQGQLLLQTTPGSTAEEVQRSTPPRCDPQPPLETVTIDILGFSLKDQFCCPQHHQLFDLPCSQYVNCSRCDLKYSQADLIRVLSGKVRDRKSDRVVELKDVHVRSLLKEALDGGLDTIRELEKALGEICFLQVTFYQNCVISVSRTSR